MSPYIDLKEATCSSCDRHARAKIVLMPNGFVIYACRKHLLELAVTISKERESEK
jgi:hypothetical protein